MEARQKTNLVYVAIIAVLAIIAGALFFAYRGLSDEGERLAAANRTLSGERDALRRDAQTQRERVLALEAELKALQEKSVQLAAEKDQRIASAGEARKALEDTQSELRRKEQEAQKRLEALTAEKEALAKQLADLERKAGAAAAARADLSRELKATEQTLEEARARSAKLNKAYESLLKDKSQLAAANTARRAELENTRKAFEEAQAELARLTGARGIYTVQNADSLSKIAAFFYRDGNRWPDIFKANAFLTDGPDLIYPSQVLVVPQ